MNILVETINKLNIDIWEQLNEPEESPVLHYQTDGMSEVITFLGIVVYDNDIQPTWIDDDTQEHIEVFLRRQINTIALLVSKIKL